MPRGTDAAETMKIDLAPRTAELVENAGEAAGFLKKLAHPSRLMVICTLVDGERSVRDLEDTLGIRQPGLSQQLAELRQAGLVVGRKESKRMYYRLADERIAAFAGLLHEMFCSAAQTSQRLG